MGYVSGLLRSALLPSCPCVYTVLRYAVDSQAFTHGTDEIDQILQLMIYQVDLSGRYISDLYDPAVNSG